MDNFKERLSILWDIMLRFVAIGLSYLLCVRMPIAFANYATAWVSWFAYVPVAIIAVFWVREAWSILWRPMLHASPHRVASKSAISYHFGHENHD